MTSTAKNMTAVLPQAESLTWTATTEWGTVGRTYRAKSDGWKFTADSPRKGEWVIRGWGPDEGFFYRTARTLKAAKTLAEEKAASVREAQAAATPVVAVDEGAELLATAGAAGRTAAENLSKLTPVMQKLAESAREVVGKQLSATLKGIRGGVWNNISRPRGCECPTPTHTMRCGHGGRPKVVQRAARGGAA
jgi:hypothetical protein